MNTKEQLREQLKSFLKFSKTNPELLIGFVLGFALIIFLAGALLFKNIQNNNESMPEADNATAIPVLKDLPTQPVIDLPVIYEVQKGDSSWKIAEAFYGCGEAYTNIEAANNLAHDSMLEIGQQLVIPHVEGACSQPHLSGSVSQEPDVLSSAGWRTGEELSKTSSYEVAPGDCLWSIALEQTGNPYNWVEIYGANKDTIGNNPDLIYPKTLLKVPQSLY